MVLYRQKLSVPLLNLPVRQSFSPTFPFPSNLFHHIPKPLPTLLSFYSQFPLPTNQRVHFLPFFSFLPCPPHPPNSLPLSMLFVVFPSSNRHSFYIFSLPPLTFLSRFAGLLSAFCPCLLLLLHPETALASLFLPPSPSALPFMFSFSLFSFFHSLLLSPLSFFPLS